MFLDGVPPITFDAPWQQSLTERIMALRRRSASIRIAYLYETPDTSTFRYRIYNMIQALDDGAGDIAATWFAEADMSRLSDLLPCIDTLVICRMRYSHDVNRLITRARSLGCSTVFDCDDLVFDIDYTHLILNTLDQALYAGAWDHWYAYIGRIGATANLCDRAIVTNDYLAARFHDFSPGIPVSVVPNFLNREQVDLAQEIYAAKRAGGWRRSPQIHLGYFSGTPTHNKDFAVLSASLARLMAQDSRLVLRLVGFLRPPRELMQFNNRIERHELLDFLNLMRLIGSTEFNLAPLQDNPFTNCKSELKYFEAAAVGTISLTSPSFAFRRAIRDGVTGYLVNSTDWEETLTQAIAAIDSYPAMAEAAFSHAMRDYSAETLRRSIRAAVLNTPPGCASSHEARCASVRRSGG